MTIGTITIKKIKQSKNIAMAKASSLYKQGDMVLIPYPYTDLSSIKKRPVIIVSPDSSNQDAFIVVKVTSVIYNDAFSFPLNNIDLSVPLVKPSEARTNQLFSAHKTLIIRRLSKLKRAALIDLNEAIKVHFDVS
jgi:mRNA interferase MazF